MSILSCSLRWYLGQRPFTEPGSIARMAVDEKLRVVAGVLIGKGC